MFRKSNSDISNHSFEIFPIFSSTLWLTIISAALFISFIMWQEYQLYQVNKAFEDFPTAAGYDEQSWQTNTENDNEISIEANTNDTFQLVTNTDANGTSDIENNIAEVGEAIQSTYSYVDALFDVDMFSGKTIDVTDVTYISSRGVIGNQKATGIDISKLEYSGDVSYHDVAYIFLDNDELVASGFTSLDWNENNAVLITIKSPTSSPAVSIASLYFRAKPITGKVTSVNLLINNEENIIELIDDVNWVYIRVDIEFQGEVQLELKPVGISEGSKLDFAGMTLL